MADDLHHVLEQSTEHGEPVLGRRAAAQHANPAAATATPIGLSGSDNPVRIVPRGLRSFDSEDADFFLELLPGPRDRNGLPDSIHFWKSRIEEMDPDNTFPVGLVYGPSGCGKSSLFKAGLLPRLSDNVIAIYVEASAAETESRLLNARCASVARHCQIKWILRNRWPRYGKG